MNEDNAAAPAMVNGDAPPYCPICLDPCDTNGDVVVTGCGHRYHLLCAHAQVVSRDITPCALCTRPIEFVFGLNDDRVYDFRRNFVVQVDAGSNHTFTTTMMLTQNFNWLRRQFDTKIRKALDYEGTLRYLYGDIELDDFNQLQDLRSVYQDGLAITVHLKVPIMFRDMNTRVVYKITAWSYHSLSVWVNKLEDRMYKQHGQRILFEYFYYTNRIDDPSNWNGGDGSMVDMARDTIEFRYREEPIED